ncbi:MAG TPA: pantoate--beta-alanine ligase [Tenuifilaceae bacterium]|nr:pantoate--beta-alanine ligase [Tenuifilaceae bacterium]HPE17425.1 pantoate--beta-alanine ligase [Tenuifilaceae bacterium]HPJ45626.1 pantoate--beta-alanine ligase [Tenuifilaceae bacterium]HPQ33496.1 pantoate--beta-alanine ligase [Tenuifilaceae bacterium]HRX66971.1 pantoate--beta-alanine ligase [Tenuifilaceae bacterium]
MQVATTVEQLKQTIGKEREQGKQVGFVPTMGALHKGHVTLVEQAVGSTDFVVVSIFVNPTQFNNPNDLKTYPRTLEHDLEKLEEAGASLVFVPSVEEIYPEPDTRVFDFGNLDKVMEGQHRPGHFNGVAQVVSKLFGMVNPHKAFFGQKDFQQLAIIRRMVEMLNLNIEIVSCPTVRESDGLAMSSRNMLLNPMQRASAPIISKTLTQARNFKQQLSVKEMIEWVNNEINKNPELNVEYFEIADAKTLQPVNSWNDSTQLVGCIAVQVGQVRLIDNILF